MLYCILVTAIADFLLFLDDILAEEHTTATFECKVTDPSYEVTWMLNNEVVEEGDKFHFEREGDVAKLVIADVLKSDEGPVKAVVQGKETSANLLVEGRCNIVKKCCVLIRMRLLGNICQMGFM